MSRDLKALIGKLNPVTRKALEKAAELCQASQHFNVEIEHFLTRLLEAPEGEFGRILRYYELDRARLEAELQSALGRFKRGNTRTPTLSPQILDLLEEAWMITSVALGGQKIRSGALVLALLTRDTLRSLVLESCPQLLRIVRDRLAADLPELLRGFGEEDQSLAAPPTGLAPIGADGPVAAGSAALDQYTVDLTAAARTGRIDPVQGRDGEIRQIVDILMRRRQNNPILTGEPGVGKTAVVEGFALRIAAGDVPPPLRNVTIRVLDLALLQAGAGLKGEFEQRLKSVIAEASGSAQPVILFIDEAHTMIGAGGPAGQGDAANILKPALARGELRTIAATTWAEYKKYFEKDPALARRFQVVKIGEPDEASAELMLRGLVAKLEQHHKVRILEEAVGAAVRLSSRYIAGRQLPDKAISVLDTAAARVAVAQAATPAAVEAARRRLEQIADEVTLLERERHSGHEHGDRLARLRTEHAETSQNLAELEQRWRKEAELGRAMLATLDQPHGTRGTVLETLRQELAALQGDEPMVPVWVDGNVVADVIAGWTGVPLGRMMTDEIGTVLRLEERMAERLVGQPQALSAIARRIRTYRADMGEPGKPVGVFLLCGPSGVGKTETALTLADLLYGGERSLITINMSEYQEPHSVALLKGAPPGYVGYGQGGVLTEAVRRAPYSVVLLDEIEKAHPDVLDVFYQVFDKGVLEDAEGIEVDFRNTLILMTSNLGSETILALSHHQRPATDDLVDAIRPVLLAHFKPALLARMSVVPYFPLGDATIARIIDLKLGRIRQRLRDQHRADLVLDPRFADLLRARCGEVESGARVVDQILNSTLLPDLASHILGHMAGGQSFSRVEVVVQSDGGLAYRFN